MLIRTTHGAIGGWNCSRDTFGDEWRKFLRASQGGLCSLLTISSVTLGNGGIDMPTTPQLRRRQKRVYWDGTMLVSTTVSNLSRSSVMQPAHN
jgi:hypothetical protein